ncbi:MAG: transposase [Proteobacteria bacterium CG1_02_64_396]|nr:MAG: transposase [Proteobacteria bacterium CG1_02_64_396]
MIPSPTRWRGHALRTYRFSEAHRLYHVVAVTHGRAPHFTDLFAARQVVHALKGEERLGRARTWAFVLMPDHLHWLLELTGTVPLARVIGSMKSVAAHGMGGKVWQRGYYDHALRVEEEAEKVARYLVANPLRKGLVEEIGQYPHWDAIWV